MDSYFCSTHKKLTVRDLQLLQLETMKKIHNACHEHNINYYMIGGTLLGAIRHEGFIPWDDDIDIAMMRDDFEKFKTNFYKMFDSSLYFMQCYETDDDFRPAMIRICIKGTIHDVPYERHLKNCKNTYIDIFPIDNVPNSNIERCVQYTILKYIDRIITLKLYQIHENNTKLKIYIKQFVSTLLSVIPLRFIQKMRVYAMILYNSKKTKDVCSTVSKYGYKKQIMPRTTYGKPALYKFEDTFLYGVEKYDIYLKHLFGRNYMEIPPVEKRPKPVNVYISSIKKKM